MLVSFFAVLQVAPAIAETDSQDSALSTFAHLLESRTEKNREIETLKGRLAAANNEIDQKELTASIESVQIELAELDSQLGILASGVADSDYNLSGDGVIDLQSELEQLVQPFVTMLKSATAEARHIEQLRHKLLTAEAHRAIAEKALAGLNPMLGAVNDDASAAELKLIEARWKERLEAANDLEQTVQHQLDARLAAREQEDAEEGSVFGDFFRDRGLSVLMGVGSFALVFTVLQLSLRGMRAAAQRGGMRRSSKVRLAGILFHLLTIIAATGSMLFVFNQRADWLLLGLVLLLVFALMWMALKMLPNMLEQLTLLLNLGAVQEGERLLFDGIPWEVRKLDFYTDLVNPALSGGTVTLPVRELAGLHSRPAAADEPWFPTRCGDWVRFDDGPIAKVVFQSPETVHLVELGGARRVISSPSFFESSPVNLSTNARVEVQFGVSYKHQAIAGEELPRQLRDHVYAGLLQLVDAKHLLDVNVELMDCGANSLDYEVEADLHGDAAHLYEDVERALTRLCLDAANHYNWDIPFPQVVVHQA